MWREEEEEKEGKRERKESYLSRRLDSKSRSWIFSLGTLSTLGGGGAEGNKRESCETVRPLLGSVSPPLSHRPEDLNE